MHNALVEVQFARYVRRLGLPRDVHRAMQPVTSNAIFVQLLLIRARAIRLAVLIGNAEGAGVGDGHGDGEDQSQGEDDGDEEGEDEDAA